MDHKESPESIQKIVIFLDSRQLGGIETHIIHLARGLKAVGYPSTVWFFQNYGTPHLLEQTLKQYDIQFEYLDGSIGCLKKKISLERPLILHTHGYKAGIVGRLAGNLTKVPIVSTFHNGDQGSGLVRLYTMLDKLTSMLSHNIAVSDEIARRMPFATTVLNNFIDASEAPLIPGSKIAFVGRLSHEKGPDLFLQIAKNLPTHAFQVYGSGPMEDALKISKPENVELMGQMNNMDSYWSQIGLLCISSREEGLPMVALEAMSKGIPVAAFRLGALPELIQQNINGWIAPKENIDVLGELINHWSTLTQEQVQQLSEHCYQTVHNNYSYQAVIPKVLEIYRQAMDKKGLPWPSRAFLTTPDRPSKAVEPRD